MVYPLRNHGRAGRRSGSGEGDEFRFGRVEFEVCTGQVGGVSSRQLGV